MLRQNLKQNLINLISGSKHCLKIVVTIIYSFYDSAQCHTCKKVVYELYERGECIQCLHASHKLEEERMKKELEQKRLEAQKILQEEILAMESRQQALIESLQITSTEVLKKLKY